MSLLGAAALAGGSAARAADYPTRQVKMVVPFEPGGGTDAVARRLAYAMGQALGQTFYVENMAGADGAIGANYVAHSSPDGYTLLYANASSITIAPVLKPNVKYRPTVDFAPIGQAVDYPLLYVANPGAPFRTFAEYIAYAKANPGKVNAGSSSTGGWIATALLDLVTDTEVTIIPYKGGGPVMIDLMAGRIDVAFGSTSTTLAQIKAGTMRALAVAASKRFPDLPDVPTIAESGYPQFTAGSWNGLLAPAGTPTPIVAALSTAMEHALHEPEVIQALHDQGQTVMYTDPNGFRSFLDAEFGRWQSVVQSGKIKVPA